MNTKNPESFRGIAGVRAEKPDASNPDVTKLMQTFEQFKAAHADEVAEIKKGMADVVTAEKVERINASVGELQKKLETTSAELAEKLAAASVGPNGKQQSPDKRAYAQAFDRYFRKGADAGLGDLAVKASLQTQSDPDGGYVVPEEMETAIDRVLAKVNRVRSISRVVNVSTNQYTKLVNQGGANSGWVGETASRPETGTPALSELRFPTHEIYANPAATQTLLDDARISIEGWLAEEVQIEFAEQEGAAFINGDGVSRPRGLLSYENVANASYAWGKVGYLATGVADGFGSLSTSSPEHYPADVLINAIYGLKAGYRGNGRWLMNDATTAVIRKFKDADGNYIWQPGLQAGEPASILGYGVETDDNMPDIGANAFPVAFADFARAYLIVDRTGIRVLRDPYTNKPYVMFYTTKRVGGGIQNFEAIKLIKCAVS